MAELLKIIGLFLPEMLCKSELVRQPEPDLVMDDEENVKSFHLQGDRDKGPLIPIYHFNALGTSRLVPENGTVLDLGSGSGQYLIHLVQLRKDIQIIGLELSQEMIRLGNETIRRAGLEKRVKLIKGDMTCFNSSAFNNIDMISSIFSLHHLPRMHDLNSCMRQLLEFYEKFNCSIWLFDHNRPKLKTTALKFPEIFTPDSPDNFKKDSSNSLIASFSFDELQTILDTLFSTNVHHFCSKILNLYQIHFIESEKIPKCRIGKAADISLSKNVFKEYKMFRRLFGSVPLH